MILKIVTILLCASFITADVAHLKTKKAAILNKIHQKTHSRHKHHHKRGLFSFVPPYKAGYDIPVVSHSFIKPLLVTYPTKPVPIGVKIPLKNPYEVKYPLPVGHKVPIPYPGYGLKFPGWQKPLLIPSIPLKDDHHHQDHHIHHHHIDVKPVVPIAPAPVVPILPAPQPTVPVAQHAVPLPHPVHFHPSPSVSVSTLLPFHPRPVQIHPGHLHLKPSTQLALSPTPLVPFPQPPPLFQIRPGNAVQTSFFATYPRYPLVTGYQPQHLVPIAPSPIPVAPAPIPINPVLIGRPSGQDVHYHLIPQPQTPHFVPEHATPLVPIQTTGSSTGLHPGVVQPTHPGIFISQTPSSGWQPVTTPNLPTFPPVPTQATQITPAHGYPIPNSHHYTEDNDAHFLQSNGQDQHNFEYQHQQQYEQHHHEQNQIEQQQYDQHQLQQQFDHQQHQQQQFEHQQNQQQQFDHQQHQQQQFEHQQNQQQQFEHQQEQFEHQQQVNQEYGVPQQQLNQDYGVPQQQSNQEYGAPQQHLTQDYGVPEQQLSQEYGTPQDKLNQYGLPQQRFDSNEEEDRAYQDDNQEDQNTQRFHNHIPLGLQPPLQRPLEDFH